MISLRDESTIDTIAKLGVFEFKFLDSEVSTAISLVDVPDFIFTRLNR
jgi:hypothetical protein